MIRKIVTKILQESVKLKVKYSKFEYGLNKEKRSIPIIVSLTSFPGRFDNVELCFKSILLQKMKPDKIIVWLGSDTSDKDIKEKLSKYEKYGIQFVLDKKNNYKSHKKYIYAFKQYANAIIITFDDDIIYPNNAISTLVRTYKKYPNCIIARRVHKITWNENKINSYLKWNGEYRKEKKPSHEIFLTTGAGTLFPPNIFDDKVIDFNLIKKYALTADDVWINMMAVKNNIKIVWAKNSLPLPACVYESQKVTLSNDNVNNNKNDQYIKKIMLDFKLSKKDFIK